MGELLVAMEMASRIITQSSVWNRIIIRFSKPQQWQKRWRAPDATVKGRKEAIPVEWAADLVDLGHRSPVSSGTRVNADVYRELLRRHVVPWAHRTYPDRKYIFRRIQCHPHCQDYSMAAGGILDSKGLAIIFTGLEFTGLLYISAAFCRRRSRLGLTLILPLYVCPLPQNGTGKRRNTSAKTCRSFCRRRSAIAKKNEV